MEIIVDLFQNVYVPNILKSDNIHSEVDSYAYLKNNDFPCHKLAVNLKHSGAGASLAT